MPKPFVVLLILCGVMALAEAQQKDEPKIRVNVLNVCTPSATEQVALEQALRRIPDRPSFLADEFEVARGRTVAPEDGTVSTWVRIRREFGAGRQVSSVQYSFSSGGGRIEETMMFRAAENNKDFLQLSISNRAEGTDSGALLTAVAVANHVRMERFGVSSVALARCPQADQSAYQSIFRRASEALAQYRRALGVRRIVPAELTRAQAGSNRPRR